MPVPSQVKLEINTPSGVKRDFRLNLPWIYKSLFALMTWVVFSSFLMKFAEDWDYWVSLYFTVLNVTTVGLGDEAPITSFGRFIAGSNSLFGVLMIGWVVATVTMALQPALSFTGLASEPPPTAQPPKEPLPASTEPHATSKPGEGVSADISPTSTLPRALGAALRQLADTLEQSAPEAIWFELPAERPTIAAGFKLRLGGATKAEQGPQLLANGWLEVRVVTVPEK